MIMIRKLALAAVLGSALALPAHSQTTLTYSSWVPPTHHLPLWQQNWAAELEKATEQYQSLTRTLEDKVMDKTEELEAARREALHAFGDGRLLVERYIPSAHHVEFQVFGDQRGNKDVPVLACFQYQDRSIYCYHTKAHGYHY